MNKNIENIKNIFKKRTVYKGNMFLLDKRDAVLYIKILSVLGYKFLGFDLFKLYNDGKVQPLMNSGYDVEDSKKSDSEFLEWALDFILNNRDDIVYEIEFI